MATVDLNYIKQKRKEKYTLQQMAEKMGIKNASTYFKYEEGTYKLKAEQIAKIAMILDCEITDFFN